MTPQDNLLLGLSFCRHTVTILTLPNSASRIMTSLTNQCAYEFRRPNVHVIKYVWGGREGCGKEGCGGVKAEGDCQI